jgi:hypothetical protein
MLKTPSGASGQYDGRGDTSEVGTCDLKMRTAPCPVVSFAFNKLMSPACGIPPRRADIVHRAEPYAEGRSD